MWVSNGTWKTIYEMLKNNSNEIENLKKNVEHRKLIRVVHNEKEIDLEEAAQELGVACYFYAVDLAKGETDLTSDKLRLMLETLNSISFALSSLKLGSSNIEPPSTQL